MNNTTAYIEYYPWPCADRKAQDIVAVVLLVVGMIGNVAFLYTVFCLNEMRTVTTNVYLCHLAVADLLFLVSNGIAIVCYVIRHAVGNFDACKTLLMSTLFHCVANFTAATSFYASMLIIGAIALERYFAICQPLRGAVHLVCLRRASFVMQAMCWLVASVASVTNLLPCWGFGHLRGEIDKGQNLTAICTFFLLTICITTLYIQMVKSLWKSSHNDILNAPAAWDTEKQVMRVCLITAITFVVFLLPYIIRLILDLLIYYFRIYNLQMYVCFYNIPMYFLILNSAANPILYSIASSKYRRAFRIAFHCG